MLNLSLIYDIAEANANMTDVERLTQIYAALSAVLAYNIKGDIVEVGCNAGHTAAFLQLINLSFAEAKRKPRELHVYDSFQGLPEASSHDQYLKPGELAVTVDELHSVFAKWGAPLPHVHRGWFKETLEKYLPSTIAFGYVDADYYESTMDALISVVPRLAPGGVLIIDDYCDRMFAPRAWEGLPGVKKACEG